MDQEKQLSPEEIGVEGAITKNIELGQQLSETFNTGFDVTMTWIKD